MTTLEGDLNSAKAQIKDAENQNATLQDTITYLEQFRSQSKAEQSEIVTRQREELDKQRELLRDMQERLAKVELIAKRDVAI